MQHQDGSQPTEAPARGPGQGDVRRRGDRSLRLVLLAIAAFFLARIPVLPHRLFDPDEFEHSHAAWCVFKGMLPYKDFFEHHTPWYYYTLRPFFNWFDVDTSFEGARRFLIFGRGLSFVLTILAVVIVVRIGRHWKDRRTGLVAGLLLVGQPVFLQKTIEMRPDVLALPFFLGGLWFLLRGLAASTASTARGLRCFLAGGLGIGVAVMCTQKMLFVLPGALVGLSVWLVRGGRAGLRSRISMTLAFFAGLAVPAIATWGALAFHGAGGEFIASNFLLNARWKHTPTGQLLKLVTTSAPVLALGLVGGSLSLSRFFVFQDPERVPNPRDGQRQYGELLLLCTLVGLFAGVLVIPVAQRQYYLMPLPLVCLFAARGLFFLVERVRDRAPAWLLVVATISLAVLPALAVRESFLSRNDNQLARLRHVFDTTAPTDLVMDGWEGAGVFRPHAFYFFFIHDESLLMLPRERVEAFLNDLESGKVRPKLIAMDEHLRALGPRFLGFVARNYVSRDGFFYFVRANTRS